MGVKLTVGVTGQCSVNDTSGVVYGDIKREWQSGGLSVTGKCDINDISNVVYGDIERKWEAGGLKVTGQCNINDVSNIVRGDIERKWTPGGLRLTGQCKINDTSKVVYGDILRIAFVTLDFMSDRNAILLSVDSPTGIPWLQDEVITSAWCWKVVREDGVVMGFTSYDEDIVYSGVTYKAKTGFAPTAVSTSSDMSVDNLDANSMISDESITTEDILLGKYNNAEIEVFLINYKNPSDKIFMLRRGTIGEVSYGKNQFTAEIRGLMENFTQKSGKVTSKQCRTHLGSVLCKINLTSYTEQGSVTSIDEKGNFFISIKRGEDYFSYGIISFTSGNNSGSSMEVKKYGSDGRVDLFLPLPHKVAIGDTFTIVAGCDGNPTTCRNRFSNLVNFRGEPYTPGNNYVQNYPSSAAGNIVSEGKSAKRVTYIWGEQDITYRGYVIKEGTTTKFIISSPSGTYSADHFNGRYIMFINGEIKGKSYIVNSWNDGLNPSISASSSDFNKIANGNGFIISAS